MLLCADALLARRALYGTRALHGTKIAAFLDTAAESSAMRAVFGLN